MKKKINSKNAKSIILIVIFIIAALFSAYQRFANPPQTISLEDIPAYSSSPYVVINDNIPDFSESDMKAQSFETYTELDYLGRCGVAYACVGLDIMPTEPRGNIGQVKPTGWQISKYDFVDGQYLYNRCHLLGFQLTGENANERNLITGTRYLNVDGMLPFENEIADYVKDTGNHVLYRVTPIFEGRNLIASGVLMEAMSVEDGGDGVCFNIYAYNVQPNVYINYATGANSLIDESGKVSEVPTQSADNGEVFEYIINVKSKKFHDPGCSGASSMSEANKETFVGTRGELVEQGYEPCGQCAP